MSERKKITFEEVHQRAMKHRQFKEIGPAAMDHMKALIEVINERLLETEAPRG